MAFGWLGSFRQTQWREFRSFVLEERRAVSARLAYLDAELQRIGEITVFYARRSTVDGVTLEQVDAVTEVRTGFAVTPGSSLEKLIGAYMAQGGNPLEISLYLKPDNVEFRSELNPSENPDVDTSMEINDLEVPGTLNDQPHFGVISEKRDHRGLGGADQGGWLTWGRYPFRRVGSVINISEADGRMASQVAKVRRWINPVIKERRNNLEAKIIKLMDLREQLTLERDQVLVQALGGTVAALPLPDPSRFQPGLHVSRFVESVDSIFYTKKRRTEVTGSMSASDLGSELLSGQSAHTEEELISGLARADSGTVYEVEASDFETVNIASLAKFDTLWVDEPDDDTYSAL